MAGGCYDGWALICSKSVFISHFGTKISTIVWVDFCDDSSGTQYVRAGGDCRRKSVLNALGEGVRQALVPDIGEHLWQLDYWDDLISSEDEFLSDERYIRVNPRNCSRDRWGAVTTHVPGEESLLNLPKHVFVASQGFPAATPAPRCVETLKRGASVPPTEDAVLISTFTSAQEHEVLLRALVKKRGIIHV